MALVPHLPLVDMECAVGSQAFTYLTKKLKPYEGQQSHPEEFRNLCYLLTCKSISEVEKEWDGIAAARNKLANVFGSLMTDSELTEVKSESGVVEVGTLHRIMPSTHVCMCTCLCVGLPPALARL